MLDLEQASHGRAHPSCLCGLPVRLRLRFLSKRLWDGLSLSRPFHDQEALLVHIPLALVLLCKGHKACRLGLAEAELLRSGGVPGLVLLVCQDNWVRDRLRLGHEQATGGSQALFIWTLALRPRLLDGLADRVEHLLLRQPLRPFRLVDDRDRSRRVRNAGLLGLQGVEHVELLGEQHLQVDLAIAIQQGAELVNLPVVELAEGLLRLQLVLDDEIGGQLRVLLQDHVVQELHEICVVQFCGHLQNNFLVQPLEEVLQVPPRCFGLSLR